MLHQNIPPAPPAIVAPATASDRNQFPSCRNWGAGQPKPAGCSRTVWYHISLGGDEVITYPDGTHETEFVLDGFKLELEESYLGLGHLEQIRAEAAARYPGKSILDWWLCKAPANEF